MATVKTLSQTVTTLEAEGKAKGGCILALQGNSVDLFTKVDNLEQHRRRHSDRIFGFREEDPGHT